MLKWRHKLPKKVKIVDRERFILNMCSGKKVLHLGCTGAVSFESKVQSGSLFHLKIIQVAKEAWGVDIDRRKVDKLKGLGFEHLILGDVEGLDAIAEIENQDFEIFVAGEIIEHLANPGLFLKTAAKILPKNALMIITTPNAFRIENFLGVLIREELIHPEHNFLFSPISLAFFVKKFGYEVKEICVARAKTSLHFKKSDSLIFKLARVIFFLVERTLLEAIIRFSPFFASNLIFVVGLRQSSADNIYEE